MWITLGLVLCANLMADTLPAGDSLSISLDPLSGAVSGQPGSAVGWGFEVDWTSTNGDWISFTGSSVGSESNPSILTIYNDFIGAQGGPVDFAVSPTTSPWIESFDGAAQGVGSYLISGTAVVGAQDLGRITFNYDVYNGDPMNGGSPVAQGLSYSGRSTEFSVLVTAPQTSVPEPPSLALLCAGLLGLVGMSIGTRLI
jgi:hypothetical protein